MKRLLALAFAVAACGPSGSSSTPPDGAGGGGGGGAGGGGGGGAPMIDAPSFPATITIAGQAIVQDQSTSTPQAGVAIGVYASSDQSTALATTTTDGSGNYSLAVPTHGAPIDGYIKATKSGLVDTYVYPPVPMATDESNAVASMISSDNYSELVGVEGGDTSNGVIILDVLDSSQQPVTGATVATSPASGEIDYMNSDGEPFSTSGTYSDGLAFVFDVPTSGAVSVQATKSGMTFTSHAVTARGGTLTTTLVLAQ